MNIFKTLLLWISKKHLKHENRNLTLILAFFIAGTLGLSYYFQVEIVQEASLNNANLYTRALRTVRDFYTSEVVIPSREHGVLITHDYKEHDYALPLPATFLMELGNLISQQPMGAKATLYSLYPFPMREKTGGLRDIFAREAWSYLSQNPKKAFYKFEKQEGQSVLRYATADIMHDTCVGCHNSHPDSPKTNWRVNEVRGILEVVLPMNDIESGINKHLLVLGTLLGLVFITGLLILRRVFKQPPSQPTDEHHEEVPPG